jgi:hypothetical protein
MNSYSIFHENIQKWIKLQLIGYRDDSISTVITMHKTCSPLHTMIKRAPSCSLRKLYLFHNAEISCSCTCMDCVPWDTIITQKAPTGYAGGITQSYIGVCPCLTNQHTYVHNDKVSSYGMVLIMWKDLIWKAWSSSHNPLSSPDLIQSDIILFQTVTLFQSLYCPINAFNYTDRSLC